MESIKISITKLGRIANSELTLAPLMLFSGESGMGKSYAAMLCHYFFEVLVDKNRVGAFLSTIGCDYAELREKMSDSGVLTTVKKSDLEAWLAEDALQYLGYMVNSSLLNSKIEVHLPTEIPNEIVFKYVRDAVQLDASVNLYTKISINESLVYTLDTSEDFWLESPLSLLLRGYLKKCIFGDHNALERTFVLPPSRGSVMTEKITAVSGMYQKFLRDKDYLESAKEQRNLTSKTVTDLLMAVIGGHVTLTDSKYYYEETGMGIIPLSAAASSVRELAPLELLIHNTNIERSAILIEEPEAHLHPTKQRTMADLIVALLQVGACMQITTHSDYFLRRFNELWEAQRITKDNPGQLTILEIIKAASNAKLSSTNVKAYLLERQEDGTSKIIEQDLLEGVPYTAFLEPLRAGVQNSEKLSEAIRKEE